MVPRSRAATRPAPEPAPRPDRPAPECAAPLLHYDQGRKAGAVCPDRVRALGLTVLDLSDDWTPALFAPGPDGDSPDYRATFLDLANARLGGEDMARAREDGYFELFGVFPTLSVVSARMADAARHACHDAVDDTALDAVARTLREEPRAAAVARRRRVAQRRAALDLQRARGGHADLDALAATSAWYRREVARYRAAQAEIDAIRAAQAHLACEGMLARERVDGLFTWQTSEALGRYQRAHFVLARGQLDAGTRAAMREDSRAHGLRAALRVLRERVVDATGAIEDGSARNAARPVLGHWLDPAAMRQVSGHAPLPDGAPDLVSEMTEAAARQLGWTDRDGVASFLRAVTGGEPEPRASADAADASPASRDGLSLRVAVRLPPLPDYYAPHMQLTAEIDLGARGARERRPALTLFAHANDRRVALVRWPTTIGGWQDYRTSSGAVVRKFMGSPVGPRVWRDMYAAPTWFAPESTPDHELVRRVWGGRRKYAAKQAVIGPGYRSAYGLVMLIHHQEVERGGEIEHRDQGIRTHGSANFTSITSGTSHGCHRLFNHLAIRLASFLLRHRDHTRHGEVTIHWRRVVRHGRRFVLQRDTRGYRFELTPPVPIEVIDGNDPRIVRR